MCAFLFYPKLYTNSSLTMQHEGHGRVCITLLAFNISNISPSFSCTSTVWLASVRLHLSFYTVLTSLLQSSPHKEWIWRRSRASPRRVCFFTKCKQRYFQSNQTSLLYNITSLPCTHLRGTPARRLSPCRALDASVKTPVAAPHVQAVHLRKTAWCACQSDGQTGHHLP